MAWHPPIPAGKLYSEPALNLGSGIALLAWCYDGVRRDGTIEVSLEKAASELNRPYRTIKDWWKQLRSGPFFCELIDRGKRGWVAKLADDWLDWHIMSNNYPQLQGRNNVFDDVQGPVKAPSRPGEGRNNVFDDRMYKEDHHDQESEGEWIDSASEEPPPTHPAIAVYVSTTKVKPPRISAEMIASQVTDLPRWEKEIKRWLASGHKPNNVTGMLDWYHGKGRHQNGTQPERKPTELPLIRAGPSNKKVLTPDERRKIADEIRNERS